MYSDWFRTGNGEQWRLILFPNENNRRAVGLFLEMDLTGKPISFQRPAHFTFEAYFTRDYGKVERKIHQYCSESFQYYRSDWGYRDFIEVDSLSTYLDRPLFIEVSVKAYPNVEQSRSITGYVGLVNEGTTCYMNSLLQTLFFIHKFRNAVYAMPTSMDDEDKLPLALQKIFYKLQTKNTPASTRELLESFGWGFKEVNTQHDVQEFNCVLSDTLERKMKGTSSEGFYSQYFEGIMLNYIQCKHVEFRSTREEKFVDIQLNVKGCKNIYESFDRYVEVEELVGDNQYDAEHLGKQDARKGVIFKKLPPVLQLQLKRFEYDPYKEEMVKLNNSFEFVDTLDLNRYVSHDIEEDYTYCLYSILVHSGSPNSGHYFAFISPRADGNWFKFNDDAVDTVIPEQAFHSSFGGDMKQMMISDEGKVLEYYSKNDTSAYMLVYIQRSKIPELLLNPDQEQIPCNLVDILSKEDEERDRLERKRQQKARYCDIFVVSREIVIGWDRPGITLAESILYSSDTFSNDPRRRLRMRVPKNYTISKLKNYLRKYIPNNFKLYSFKPAYRNWDFKELNDSASVEHELTVKEEGIRALYIEVEEGLEIFQRTKGTPVDDEEETQVWEFKYPMSNGAGGSSTDESAASQSTEIMDQEQVESALVFLKWYEFHGEMPVLRMVDVVRISHGTTMNSIRECLYKSYYGNTPEEASMINLYLEKSKYTDSSKEITSNINSFGANDNYELNVNRKGGFGVKYVMIENGDIFVGELYQKQT